VYRRKNKVKPQVGPRRDHLDDWMRSDTLLFEAGHRLARRLFECLQAERYSGAYNSIQHVIRQCMIEPRLGHPHNGVCPVVPCRWRCGPVLLEPRTCVAGRCQHTH
jgi:hypothetical protein